MMTWHIIINGIFHFGMYIRWVLHFRFSMSALWRKLVTRYRHNIRIYLTCVIGTNWLRQWQGIGGYSVAISYIITTIHNFTIITQFICNRLVYSLLVTSRSRQKASIYSRRYWLGWFRQRWRWKSYNLFYISNISFAFAWWLSISLPLPPEVERQEKVEQNIKRLHGTSHPR